MSSEGNDKIVELPLDGETSKKKRVKKETNYCYYSYCYCYYY